MLEHVLNGKLFKSDDNMTNLGDYSWLSKPTKMNVYIPFTILSENQNNDRYTEPSSVQFVRCERSIKLTCS